MKREENSIEAECIEKLCNLFIFTSPSVLKIQFLALYGQREEVLLFILHTLTFLCFEHFPNYMQNHFWNQILMLWWPITEKRSLRRNMVRNLGTKALIRKTDFLTQTSKIISNHLIDFRQILIDLSDELILIINIKKTQTKLI